MLTAAVGAALPLGTAFAANDYPLPPPPTVGPGNIGRTTPVTVGGETVTRAGAQPATAKSGNGVEVLGIQVTRGSLPFTGGDVAELAAFGVGTVALGAVLVRRSRSAHAGAGRGDS